MTYDIESQVSRRTRRVLTGVVVVVLAAVVAVCAAWWYAYEDGKGSGSDSGTEPGGGSGSSVSVGASGGDVDGPGSGAPSVVGTAAQGAVAGAVEFGALSWVDVRGMALPVSGRYGPASVGGGRAYGFSHDAGGAVLAGVHLCARTDAIVGPDVFRATIREQVTGTEAEKFAVNVDEEYERRRAAAGVAPDGVLPETHVRLVGYRVESYGDDAAHLRVLVGSPGVDAQGTVFVDFRIQVRWVGGDWRLVAPAGGDWRTATVQVGSADGYVPFPGRR